ncbi:glycosyltransferase family 32 protein [Candidatus Finniella inopinata]|nr:glycosyltransferase [Candidatus Finniella inopinata]
MFVPKLTVGSFLAQYALKRIDDWQTGPRYFRYAVAPEEKINADAMCRNADENFLVNHPRFACSPDILLGLDKPRIPLISHTIWLTSTKNPRELTHQYLTWYKTSIQNNLRINGWQHYFWIQDEKLLPKTLQALGSDIEVKLIGKDLPTDFPLKNYFEQELTGKKYGKASDILRCVILDSYGGVYRDVDLEFLKPLAAMNYGYDLYVGMEYHCGYPGNAFIASRSGHPVIKRMLEIIDRNFDVKRAPKYINNTRYLDWDGPMETICQTGPVVLGVALATAKRDSKDKDIVLPPQVLLSKGEEHETLTSHGYTGSWMDASFGSNG